MLRLYKSEPFYFFSNKKNKDTDMLQYWNMVLTEEQSYHERIRYKMLDIMGEVGGVTAVLMSLMWIIMYPLTYKTHHISVYKEYMKHIYEGDDSKECPEYPKFLSIKYFLYKNIPCLKKILDSNFDFEDSC